MSKALVNRQWQTARAPVTAADTALTDYIPSELSAAVKLKMFSVYPATGIILRFFGKDAADEVSDVKLTGFMDFGTKNGPGPGQHLWNGTVTLGAFSWSGVPITDGKWGADATWLEADTITDGLDMVGVTEVNSTDLMSMLVVPTLGYTQILIEFVATFNVAAIGALWRPVAFGANYGLLPRY